MLLWFRNDLRVHDNPALLYFLQHREAEHNRALFFVSKAQWQSHDDADIKIDLMLRHVNLLSQQLVKYGITLTVVECDTFAQQIDYLQSYCQKNHNAAIIVNQEVEYNEVERDRQLRLLGLNLVSFEADVIVPKGQVLNLHNEMYKVFTPFKKAWIKKVKQQGFDYIPKYALDQFESNKLENTAKCQPQKTDIELIVTDASSDAWPLIDTVEANVIPDFLADKLEHYADTRDIPSIKGTSGLSPYLAIGALSPRYVLTLLMHKHPDLLHASDSKTFVWLNELIWREFYRHLLYHFPRLCKGKNFNEKYNSLQWLNNQEQFLAWCQGKTGYPIVDAAMLQLNQTGWMHNRLRMIVASFLTKHLLIDWRWGEQYFKSRLIDGDLAANNGGWQWAASTGCDAQPYFRIFNPIRQSENFDPKGIFIRKYLPMLNDVPNKEIHFPHKYIAKLAAPVADLLAEKPSENASKKLAMNEYWPAIVDHKAARERALACYKQV